ncbi:MAG: hypothetical protein QM813_24480 [Verrucomicrobiota bacterium]
MMKPPLVTHYFKNTFRPLWLIALYICGGVGCFAADNQASNSDAAEATTTSVQTIRTASLEPLRRILITKGTNELLLVAPQDLRIDTAATDKVSFVARDLTYYVSIRIIPAPSGLVKGETLKFDSDWVLENYPGASVTEEFSIPTGEGDCKLINFNWPVNGLMNRVGRIGLIQTATGLVEFVMLADPRQAKAASDDFHAVLCSLQTNKHGPIKLPPVPDHS